MSNTKIDHVGKLCVTHLEELGTLIVTEYKFKNTTDTFQSTLTILRKQILESVIFRLFISLNNHPIKTSKVSVFA